MPLSQAAVACKACRRLKRKCTRNLPSCSLCVRLSKVCEYPVSRRVDHGPRDSHDVEEAHASPSSAVQDDGASARFAIDDAFPSSYFLDPDHFTMLHPDALCENQRRIHRFAPHDANEILERYMSTIHTWLPILSYKRLARDITSPRAEAEAATSLLLPSVKLAVQAGGYGSNHNAEDSYRMVKQRCFEAESSASITLPLIQSLVFLAVYELGHAIHPCAYLTIGRAARLCGLVGLQSRKYAQQLFREPDTWTFREEQRRTWWAVYVLDRVINLGTSGLPLSVPEPGEDTLLPCHDADWTAGKIGPNQALLTQTFHSTTDIGSFARTCQAAHMLGKVFRHVDPERYAGMDVTERLLEALQLHEGFILLDIHLQEHFPDTPEAISPALAICCSARFLLYGRYGCNEADRTAGAERIALETEAQTIALRDIEVMASVTVPGIARSIIADGKAAARPGLCGNPLVAHCLYDAATECAWFIRENHEEKMAVALRGIVHALRELQKDWRVGAEYLTLLDTSGILALYEEVGSTAQPGYNGDP